MTELSPDIRPGHRLLVLPCLHCFNCYCYCIVDPVAKAAAQRIVDHRLKTSMARAANTDHWTAALAEAVRRVGEEAA